MLDSFQRLKNRVVNSKFAAPGEPFYSNQFLDTLSIKLQEPLYHPAVHAFSNIRVASQ